MKASLGGKYHNRVVGKAYIENCNLCFLKDSYGRCLARLSRATRESRRLNLDLLSVRNSESWILAISGSCSSSFDIGRGSLLVVFFEFAEDASRLNL